MQGLTGRRRTVSGTASLKVVTVSKEVPAGSTGDAAVARLPASAGESLAVLERTSLNGAPHYWVINRKGQFGVVPLDSVRVVGTGLFVVAREAFAGGAAKIAFAAGERIELVERVSAEWWHGINAAGHEGRFPSELVDDASATVAASDEDRGKGALRLQAQVYAGRSKWEGEIRLRSFETARDAMQLALRSASVSDDRIFTCALYSSDHKCFVAAFTPMAVAKFKVDAKVRVYDFSVQIRKIQTGDTANSVVEPVADTKPSSASSASSSSSRSTAGGSLHRHHRHHHDSDHKKLASSSKARSHARSSTGDLTRSKSSRRDGGSSSGSGTAAAVAESESKSLRRNKSTATAVGRSGGDGDDDKRKRGGASGLGGASLSASQAAAAAAVAALAATTFGAAPTPPPPLGASPTPPPPLAVKPAPPPGAPPADARRLSQLASASQPSLKAHVAAAEKAPSKLGGSAANAVRAPPADEPVQVLPAAQVRETPLRGHEAASLDEPTIRRLRDRQAEVAARLQLLEQWHSGKAKEAGVLEEMMRLGIEQQDIAATLAGEKSVEEFNNERLLASGTQRKPSPLKTSQERKSSGLKLSQEVIAVKRDDAAAVRSTTPPPLKKDSSAKDAKELAGESKKQAKDSKKRSDTAPPAPAAEASTASTAAAPAPAAAAAAAAPTEPRRSKTLLPKSLQPAKLPEDHAEVSKKLRDILDKPWEQVLVFKDTYRLARRFQVYDGGKRVIDGSAPALAEHSPLKTFCRVVQCIADRLETPARAAEINKACDTIVATESDAPPDLLIRQLFEKSIGLDSRTAAVFRPVHQGVIMPVTFWLKSKTRLLSKDVSTADGWRILIEFERLTCDASTPADAARDVDGRRVGVTITHYRKEQGLVAELEERFVVEYRIRFRLNAALRQTSEFDIKFTRVDVDRQRAFPDILDALLPLEQWNKTTPLLSIIDPGPRGRELYGELVCIRPDIDGAPAAAAEPAKADDDDDTNSSSASSSAPTDALPPVNGEDAALHMSVMAQVVSNGGYSPAAPAAAAATAPAPAPAPAATTPSAEESSSRRSSSSSSSGDEGSSADDDDDDDGDEAKAEDEFSSESEAPPEPTPRVIVEALPGANLDDTDTEDELTYSTEDEDA